MEKETFYFPHDYNAIQDPKMIRLLSTCGLAGIGLYWIIIEILHQQPNKKILYTSFLDYMDLYSSTIDEELFNKIIKQLKETTLLVHEGDFIFSNRVLKNQKKREKISKARSMAGKKSAYIKKNKELSEKQQMLNKCSTNENQLRNNKIKEKKRKEKSLYKVIPPKIEDVIKYCEERNSPINPQVFFDNYESKGWFIGKNKMKDWAAAVRYWERNEKQQPDNDWDKVQKILNQ